MLEMYCRALKVVRKPWGSSWKNITKSIGSTPNKYHINNDFKKMLKLLSILLQRVNKLMC